MAAREETTLACGAGPAPAQRVMISRMVLDNFKSYAGPVTIGPFDSNMTSVVGPNGSGKSNVIDAMLFVFGFRAKQMRQGNLSELIHSSSNHPSLAYTRVSVHFRDVIDLEDGTVESVEGTELVVAREARRDNSSTYWVNDKKSNRTDVTAMLKKRGIDLDHNRFLILQGEVEQIAMMKPKAPSAHEDGLLEYLEDIIGSNRLQQPISEAQQQVEQLNESRASRLNALKAVEQQMQALEGRKAEAETYVHTETQLHEKRSALYQINEGQCQAVIVEAETKVQQLGARLRDEQDKAKLNAGELADLEKAYKKGKREHEKVLAALDESRKQFQKFEREDIQKREEKSHLKSQIKKANTAAEKDARRLAALDDELGALGADAPRLQGEVEAAAATKQKAEAELEVMYDGIRGQTEPLRRQVEEIQREREPLAQALAGIASEQTLAQGEAQMLADKAAAGASAVDAAGRNLEAHDEMVERSRAEFDAHASTGVARQQQLIEKEARLAHLAGEEAQLTEEHRSSCAKLEESSADRSGASSRDHQLRALMAAKKDGSIPGLIGRLGSLGTIAAEYDCAISTACGALDFVVVDDTNAAQQCVELMREKQLGVATFIVLDKQSHLQPQMRPIEAPKGSQRLFDLVQCPELSHRAAFYYALHDTLVCDEKDLASNIATGGAKRWRVVTTDGVVINPSGTMEGGGKPIRGRMGGRASEGLSEAEMTKLRKHVDSLATQLDNIRAECSAIQAELRDAKKESKRVEVLHNKLAMQLEAAAAQRTALEQRLQSARDASELGAAEVRRQRELEKELAAIAKHLAGQKKLVDAVDARLAVLQEEVLSVGGIKLRAQKSKVETLSDQLSGLRQSLTKTEVDLESRIAARDKLQASLTKQKAATVALEKAVEAAEAALKRLEDDAFEVHEKYKECETECAAKEEALKAMQSEYEAFKMVVAKVRVLEVDFSTQIDDYQRSAKEHAQKVQYWRQKLVALRVAAAQNVELLAAGVEGEGAAPTLPDLSAHELGALDAKELQAEVAQLEEVLQGMSPNLSVIAEYRAREAEWRTRLQEFDTVSEQRDTQRKLFEDLRKQRLAEFMTGFKVIGLRLKEMYQASLHYSAAPSPPLTFPSCPARAVPSLFHAQGCRRGCRRPAPPPGPTPRLPPRR